MRSALFQQFADVAYRRAGIRLGPGKEALVEARISKRLRVLGLQRADDYLDHLLGDNSGEEIIQFLDVISTNFTSFFREAEHFEHLSKHVKGHCAAGRSRLRFWSAACSSGEEPYTMALSIGEALGQSEVDWRILATDISTRILQRATNGIYPESALRTVPRHLRAKYFSPVDSRIKEDRQFRIHDQLRQRVTFKRLNLSTPPFPMRGPIDFVMCRNVMIYFDRHVRQNLIHGIEELLAPDGVLCIGHAETLNGLQTRLRAVRPSMYTFPDSSRRSTGRATQPPKAPNP